MGSLFTLLLEKEVATILGAIDFGSCVPNIMDTCCSCCQGRIITAHFIDSISEPIETKTHASLCGHLQTWEFHLFDSKDQALFTTTPHCLPRWKIWESRHNREPWKAVSLRSQCSPPASNVRISSQHSFIDLIQ